MKIQNSKIVVLGVGNVLRQDEGVGVHVVNELKTSNLKSQILNLEVIDGGTLGIDLIPYIENAYKLIIVDAVRDGNKPGTIYKLKIEDCRLKVDKEKLSLHQIDLIDTLKIMEMQNKLPQEIVIVGVEPKNFGWGETLSEEVKEKIPEILSIVHSEIINCKNM